MFKQLCALLLSWLMINATLFSTVPLQFSAKKIGTETKTISIDFLSSTSISPNGDGQNDELRIKLATLPEDGELLIQDLEKKEIHRFSTEQLDHTKELSWDARTQENKLIPQGTYYIRALDAYGRTLASRSFQVDYLKPQVQFVYPSVEQSFELGVDARLLVKASDNQTLAAIRLIHNGKVIQRTHRSQRGYEFNLPALSEGKHEFLVEAYDFALNQRRKSYSYQLKKEDSGEFRFISGAIKELENSATQALSTDVIVLKGNQEFFQTGVSEFVLEGFSDPSYDLFIDGEKVSRYGNVFSQLLQLQPGENVFEVLAKDGEEVHAKWVTVVYDNHIDAIEDLGFLQYHNYAEVHWTEHLEAQTVYVTRSPGFGVKEFRADKDGVVALSGEKAVKFQDFDLIKDKAYTYTLVAEDRFGNRSEPRSIKVNIGTEYKVIGKSESTTIGFGHATLFFDGSNLAKNTKISIAESSSHVGDEVFYQASKLYKLGPAGIKFIQPIQAEIKYDRKAIAPGYSVDDLRVFLRNGPGHDWEQLEIVDHDKQKASITALVPHFSEISVGYVSAPKDPQTRFNVNTSLPKFELPDPLAGHIYVEAPVPNNNGNLQQSIPIVVPSGKIGGFTPGINLSYGSGSGNGLLGVGWGIQTDAISRSTKDGIPSYDLNDTFFFNGSELLFKESLVDADGLSYRKYVPKREGGFADIRYYTGGASDYWKVIQSGTVSYYGKAPSMSEGIHTELGRAVEATHDSNYKWYLTRQEIYIDGAVYDDITYTYVETDGKVIPKSIYYNDDKLRVHYAYKTRPDVQHFFNTGKVKKISQRLENIFVELDKGTHLERLRTYGLSYVQDSVTGASLLNVFEAWYGVEAPNNLLYNVDMDYFVGGKVYELDQTWNNRTNGDNSYDAKIDYAEFRRRIRDMDGDGYGDMIVNLEGTDEEAEGKFRVFYNSGTNFTQDGTANYWKVQEDPSYTGFSVPALPFSRFNFANIDKDKHSDLIVNYTGLNGVTGIVRKVFLADPTTQSFVLNENFSLPGAAANELEFRIGMRDINGDKLLDYLVSGYGKEGVTAPEWLVYTNTESGFVTEPLHFNVPNLTVDDFRVQLMDINGDQKVDYVINNTGRAYPDGTAYENGSYEVYINSGEGFYPNVKTFAGPDVDENRKQFTDFNADGLLDIMVNQYGIQDGMYHVYLNDSQNFSQEKIEVTGPSYAGFRQSFRDVNGDGRSDIVVNLHGTSDAANQSQDGMMVTYMNKMIGPDQYRFELAPSYTFNHGDSIAMWRYQQKDLTGDSVSDLFVINDGRDGFENGSFTVRKRKPSFHNFLKAIKFNKQVTSFDYALVNEGFGYGQSVLRAYTVANTLPQSYEVNGEVRINTDHYSLTTTYDYKRGKNDEVEEIYYGFGEVITEGADGNRSINVYSQEGEERNGLVVQTRKEVKLADDSYVVTEQKDNLYEIKSLHGGLSTMPLIKEVFTSVHPIDKGQGQASAYSKVEHIYNEGSDPAGQRYLIKEKINRRLARADGTDLRADDDIHEKYSYTDLPSSAIVLNYGPQVATKGSHLGDQKIGEERFYFDEKPLGIWGLKPTKSDSWNGVNDEGVDQYLSASKTYLPGTALTAKEYDVRNNWTEYTYDDDTRFVIEVKTELGSVETKYDYWGNELSVKDENDHWSHKHYDRWGRVLEVYTPMDEEDKPSILFEYYGDYDSEYPHTYAVRQMHRKFFNDEHLQIDEQAFIDVIAFTDGLGRTLQTKVPAPFNDDKDVNRMHVVSGKKMYDDLGRVKKVYDPYTVDGGVEEYEFLFYQIPLTTRGYHTEIFYDEVGREVRSERKSDDPDRYEGKIVSKTEYVGLYETITTDALGNVRKAVKNEYGDLKESIDYINQNTSDKYAWVSYKYDLRGNLEETRVNDKFPIVISYDILGRKIGMNDPDMGVWEYGYNEYGDLIYQIDGRGIHQATYYDKFGRKSKESIKVIRRNRRNKIWVRETVKYLYHYGKSTEDNNVNRLVRVEDKTSAMGETRYVYNALGTVVKETKDINNHDYVSEYEYDALGRIRELTYPFNKNLHKEKPDAPVEPYKVRYVYGYHSGMLKHITGFRGILSPTQPGEIFLQNIDYDEKGRRAKVTYGNGMDTKYQYDELKNRANVIQASRGDVLYQRTELTHDNVGNVTQKIQNGSHLAPLNGSEEKEEVYDYTYDDLYRLVQANYTEIGGDGSKDYTHHYTYDAFGNLLSKDSDNANGTPKDEGNWQYKYKSGTHAVSSYKSKGATDNKVGYDGASSHWLTYDKAGNLRSHRQRKEDKTELKQKTYIWDEYNRLKQTKVIYLAPRNAKYPNNGKTRKFTYRNIYFYDFTGERVRTLKNSPGRSNDGNILYVSGLFQSGLGVCQNYIYDGINRIAITKLEASFMLHHDQLGGTSMVTRGASAGLKSGQMIHRVQYSPFGEMTSLSTLNDDGSLKVRYGHQLTFKSMGDFAQFSFTGQRYDAGVELYYYGARYYDADIGRFIRADFNIDGVTDSQGFNRYAYVKNNPVNYSDPSGNFIFITSLISSLVNTIAASIANKGFVMSFNVNAFGAEAGVQVGYGKNGFIVGTSAGYGVGGFGVFASVSYSSEGGYSATVGIGFNAGGVSAGLTFSAYFDTSGNFTGASAGLYASVGKPDGSGVGVSAGFGWNFDDDWNHTGYYAEAGISYTNGASGGDQNGGGVGTSLNFSNDGDFQGGSVSITSQTKRETYSLNTGFGLSLDKNGNVTGGQPIAKMSVNLSPYGQRISNEREPAPVEDGSLTQKPGGETQPDETIPVRLKDSSVNTKNLDPRLKNAYDKIARVYEEFGQDEVVITSGNDGRHSPNSQHKLNQAIDLRSKQLSDATQVKLARALQTELGPEFRVISEHFKPTEGFSSQSYIRNNNHIHIDLKGNSAPFGQVLTRNVVGHYARSSTGGLRFVRTSQTYANR